MKKILFALAIVPLLVIGCSSDDDDKNASDDFGYNIEWLYGEWRATEVEIAEEVSIDLTDPTIEVLVAPTYLTFKAGDVYESEGILGEGTGKYVAKDKKITTSLGDKKVSFDVTSLTKETAKIKINAKTLDLDIIPDGIETVVVVLTKDYSREIDADFDVELLYGEWQATGVELEGLKIDIKDIIDPTFVTFEEKGVFSSKGILGEGTGRYAIKDKLIVTALEGEDAISFDMEELSEETAKIEIDASALDLDLIPADVEDVIVILTKQEKE